MEMLYYNKEGRVDAFYRCMLYRDIYSCTIIMRTVTRGSDRNPSILPNTRNPGKRFDILEH